MQYLIKRIAKLLVFYTLFVINLDVRWQSKRNRINAYTYQNIKIVLRPYRQCKIAKKFNTKNKIIKNFRLHLWGSQNHYHTFKMTNGTDGSINSFN